MAVLLTAFVHAQPAAVPIDPISAILDAFSSHAVVALGEGDHGNNQGHSFLLSLVRDRRFPDVVNNIVVEFGNSLHQNVIDRFENGEDVAEPELQHVWQDTTQPFATFDLRLRRLLSRRTINQ